jgi:hypothetical protein
MAFSAAPLKWKFSVADPSVDFPPSTLDSGPNLASVLRLPQTTLSKPLNTSRLHVQILLFQFFTVLDLGIQFTHSHPHLNTFFTQLLGYYTTAFSLASI